MELAPEARVVSPVYGPGKVLCVRADDGVVVVAVSSFQFFSGAPFRTGCLSACWHAVN